MKITKTQLKRMIKEETKNLRKEGFMDWFKGKKEEPAIEPEAQGDPEAAAEANWQPFEEEIGSLYKPIIRRAPSYDETQLYCKHGDCKKHLDKFWRMADAAGATSLNLSQRKEQYIKAYVEGGPKAVQDLFERWKLEGFDKHRLLGWVHRARNDGSLIVDKEWANELEGQLEFVKSAMEQSKNPRAPEPESTSREDEYEWRGGDMRRKRGYHPGGNIPVSENKVTKKSLKRMIQQELKKTKRKK